MLELYVLVICAATRSGLCQWAASCLAIWVFLISLCSRYNSRMLGVVDVLPGGWNSYFAHRRKKGTNKIKEGRGVIIGSEVGLSQESLTSLFNTWMIAHTSA